MRTKKDETTVRTNWLLDPYGDPVRYLRSFGIEAELVETKEADLPSAA